MTRRVASSHSFKYLHCTLLDYGVIVECVGDDLSPFLSGELVSRITTDTNDMSEALSEKLSLVMWYTARFGFLLTFMVSQSWKMTLLTCMGLPIIWVIPKLTGHFHQVTFLGQRTPCPSHNFLN